MNIDVYSEPTGDVRRLVGQMVRQQLPSWIPTFDFSLVTNNLPSEVVDALVATGFRVESGWSVADAAIASARELEPVLFDPERLEEIFRRVVLLAALVAQQKPELVTAPDLEVPLSSA